MTTPTADEIASTQLDLFTDDAPEAALFGVNINGVFYQYANPDNWGLLRRNNFRKLWASMQKLEEKETPNEKDEREYDKQARQMIGYICPDVPNEVVEKLSLTKRTTLVMDFFLKAAKHSSLLRLMNGQRGAPSSRS
jgi:hypothetical protein